MTLRKLLREEHGKTRKLWEKVFIEDTPDFLDYYYTVKTAENEIYVIEEDGEIRSMLHLNPYMMQMGEKTYQTHYIVAVATEEAYRRRGYMAKLLERATDDMRENGEPFTFLMPAAEGIYYPHGFRFIYRQRQKTVMGKKSEDLQPDVKLAEKKDCEVLADFANRILHEKYEVYATRDRHYYERLLQEVKSEGGGILLVRKEDEVLGFFSYVKGATYEIIEPLFMEKFEEAFYHAVYILTEDGRTEAKCVGFWEEGTDEKPMIMAKVLDVSEMMKAVSAETLLGYQIPIGDLTSLVFGYLDIEEMDLPKEIKKQWKSAKPLSKVFLNEIV